MVNYTLEHVDYSGDLRAFQFIVEANNQKAIVGNREYEEIRDYSNDTNIVGKTIKETEKLSHNFVSQQTEVMPFLAELDRFMEEKGLTYDAKKLDIRLMKHVVTKNKNHNEWMQLAYFSNIHREIFQNMNGEVDFFAMSKVLHPESQKYQLIKKKLAADEIKRFGDFFAQLSDQQKESCIKFYDLINQLSPKQRNSLQSDYRFADDMFRILSTDGKNSTKDKKEVLNQAEPYEKRFAEINSLIKMHENDIRNKGYPADTSDIERNIIELKCEFITHVITEKNPKIDKNLIRGIVSSYELVEYDTRKAMEESSSKDSKYTKESVQFDELLTALKIDATKDLIKFNFYKKNNNPEVFLDKDESDKFKTMSADEAVKTYGSTVLSQYKSAVLVMEAIKRDKKQGKDIAQVLTNLADAMGYFNQSEKDFHPDGIKQFMFDALIKDYDKFKPQGYKECLDLLAQISNNSHEYHPHRKKILDDKEKMSKADIKMKKAEIKSRLTKRAKELYDGEVISGDIVASKIAEKVARGYSVGDIDKVKESERKNTPITKIQKEIIEKFGSKNK